MEKMQWFKFSVSEWKFGKIQKCNSEVKSAFLELCCLYWVNETKLLIEDAIIECDEENYKVLISKKIIKEIDGFIKIVFLDEQFEASLEKSVKARESVEKRWQKRNTNVLKNDTNVLRTNYDSNTEEKRREEKRREEKKENNIDSRKLKFADTLKPFLNLYGKELLNEFYLYWIEPNPSNTKMRFEMQKTWSIELRLRKWVMNDKTFTAKKIDKPYNPRS